MVSNTNQNRLLAFCRLYGRHVALGTLLGFAVGFSIAGPFVEVPYKAHFIESYLVENREINDIPQREQVFLPANEREKHDNDQSGNTFPQEIKDSTQPEQIFLPANEHEKKANEHEKNETLLPSADDFPPFEKAIYPVTKTPNWGAMRTAADWKRIYAEMNSDDFVDIPVYDLSKLTIPVSELASNLTDEHIAILTAKLFYSTRHFGRYHLDSSEFEGRHPGIDFKLAAGTPVQAIAGGMVHATGFDEYLGNFVMILHRLPETQEEVVSIYGHLERISVLVDDIVSPGTVIGTVGSTGNSTGPHLHLQIDKKKSPGRHVVYGPNSLVSREEASKWTIHPIEFIAQW